MIRRALLLALLPAAAHAQAELPDPAAAPPAPPRLATTPAPLSLPPAPAWPAGTELLGTGALRFRITGDRPDPTQSRAIEDIGRRLAALPPLGRVTVESQVSAHPRDHSLARRLALARAQAVKAALVAGGLEPTRIDLRPLGRLDPPADLVDILPPGARGTAASR